MPANFRCTFYCFIVLLFDYVMHLRSWCSRRTTNTLMMMMMMTVPIIFVLYVLLCSEALTTLNLLLAVINSENQGRIKGSPFACPSLVIRL